MRTITINTNPKYNVYVQNGLLDKVGQMVNSHKNYEKIAIITDSKVEKLYLSQVLKSFNEFNNKVFSMSFPNGEASKNIVELSKIYDFLAEKEITRSDLIIALGGGVCGDMVGFASSSYLRGVDFINIPTTLLSMVDSSVGGKTAINISAGKNQVGAFYQPIMVICDTDTLKTLDEELIADGVGEIAKYAILADCDLFNLLESADFNAVLEQIIEICVKIKDDFVSGDVFDKGKRQLLNLGHTLGHVIEKDSHYSIAHGKAVLIGTYLIAEKFAGSNEITEILYHLRKVAEKFNMPISYKLSADELWKMAVNDKKRHGQYITIARPYAIGDCRLENVNINNPINLTENTCNQKFDIEITPNKLRGKITPPSSKSHLHRLLICSAFSGQNVQVNKVTFNDDIMATLNALKNLGAKFEIKDNTVIFDEFNLQDECEIDCVECGSTFRFFIPICAMLGVKTTFLGSKRLGERGYSDIINAMKDSVHFDRESGLPLNISGKYASQDIYINGNVSSQFITGIMLGAFALKKDITIHLTSELVSSSYVDITVDVIEQFGGSVIKTSDGFVVKVCESKNQNLIFNAEPDYSNNAFWAVAGVDIDVEKDNSKQADKVIFDIINQAGIDNKIDVDIDSIPDLAPILGVLSAKIGTDCVIRNCGRLRIKECDRLQATCEMLNKFGVTANIVGDDLFISGGEIKGGIEIDSYGDHRMAMAIAILASFAQSKVTLTNAQVVKKSYPKFWEDYVALGGEINVINIR